MLLLPVAFGASLYEGCPLPASVADALVLVDQGYESLPASLDAVQAFATSHMDASSCRAAYDDTNNGEVILCTSTDGVITLERNASDNCYSCGSISIGSEAWTWRAAAPPGLGWSWIEVEGDSSSYDDRNGSSSGRNVEIRWGGVLDPAWPTNGSEAESVRSTYSSGNEYRASAREVTAGDCSFSQAESSWLGSGMSQVVYNVTLSGTGWSAEVETLEWPECSDDRTPWKALWNGVVVGAVDASGTPDPADADLDGWPGDCADCDDGDPSRNPDAVEVPDDGIDQDGDGVDASAFAPRDPPPPSAPGPHPASLAVSPPTPGGCGASLSAVLGLAFLFPARRR